MRHALSVLRSENFSDWYQEVINKAELAELSDVRGCLVIKPYGYAIWERIQSILDTKFKELGHTNAYFPLFIPLDLFEKEAEHVNGFAKEMAIVTHHRLEKINGKLVPAGKLEMPVVVRPTSELVIGSSFAKWVKSYRDLPLLINQWANVVRWEMRTRMFLRTTEFLWQEGHTAHATEEEAIEETITMHNVYKWFICDVLKLFAISGKKPNYDKFAGAIDTYTTEVMVQDGKAIQAATSHFLGQNFSKATNIKFQDINGTLQYAYTTSWGLSTRIIGAIIMSHADDDGLNLPSQIAPYNIVIIPIIKNIDQKEEILSYCNKLKQKLIEYRVYIDMKDDTAQNKKWNNVRKGIPFICEIGLREVLENTVSFIKRIDNLSRHVLQVDDFINTFGELLQQHDSMLEEKNRQRCLNKLVTVTNMQQMTDFFRNNTGFVMAKWGGSNNNLELLDNLTVSIRCIPQNQSGKAGKCILTGDNTTQDVIIAKSY